MSLEDRVKKIETRFERLVSDLNSMSQKIADVVGDNRQTIAKLEKRFSKLEKSSVKTAKMAEPKKMESSLMSLVDKALAAYDKSKKR